MLSRCVVSQVKHNSYFLVGLALGLWLALAGVPLDDEPACGGAAPAPDPFEPARDVRPPAAAAPARALQRPRYYSTELGMRGSLLTGVLSSEEAIKSQIAALNHTMARLQPALKFFITASAMSSVPGLANVVGFTDTREMLKPFHALKYLADNYLEEYDFFFLVSDTAFVNARRLTELVSQLSVSEDIYMGVVAEDDSHYCSLEGGILLSNSVLRALHGELDWCVRNSYSPHHHENVGRCVLHAARIACQPTVQGRVYRSEPAGPLRPGLARAVTVRHVAPRDVYTLHAYVSREQLAEDARAVRALRAGLARAAARQPPGYRNATWPGGLRADPGLAPPPPASRFDHLRWVSFNATHALLADDRREARALAPVERAALRRVLAAARAWAARRGLAAGALLEGAWRWEPAAALRYRLLLRAAGGARLLEVLRPLGAARLVPARYVTESARLTLLLAVPPRAPDAADALAFLRRYQTVCLEQDRNTALALVALGDNSTHAALEGAVRALAAAHPTARLDLLHAPALAEAGAGQEEGPHAALLAAQRVALEAALPHLPRDALVVLLPLHAEFNQDFLNRVRMNTIAGSQWYSPMPFARYSLFAHPRWAAGARPALNTGRFNERAQLAAAFYRADYEAARPTAGTGAVSAVLARSALRVVRAPEPALVLAPRARPCAGEAQSCARRELAALDAGARHSLAQLLLEVEAETS